MDATGRDNLLLEYGLKLGHNGEVCWMRSSPDHPRNWSLSRKAFDTGLIIFLDFYSTAVSTAGAPAGRHAQQGLGLSSTTATLLFVSIYLFGQGLGGIVFPPYSECFGRKRLYIVSTLLYSIFCLVIGIIPSTASIAVCRFITGFLSAVPTIVVAGSIEDLWDTHARVWLIFAWAMVANIGLVAGPILGTYIATNLGWRWIFYTSAIVTGVTFILLFWMKESRPSLLLARKVDRIRKITGHGSLVISSPDHMPDLRTFISIALFRPLRLFFTELIVFMVALMSAVAFALIYLFTEAIPLIYSSYDISQGQKSLPFVAIGLGLICGVFSRYYDHHLLRARRLAGKAITPENKLTGFSIGAPALAVGLWWFAWTIPPYSHASWVVPTISLILVGYALNEFDAVLAGYLADSYLSYAASGFGALALLRSLLSACFPLFARKMFEDLEFNIAGSVLAGMATIFCIVPPLFSKYGERIRERSKFATYSFELQENSTD